MRLAYHIGPGNGILKYLAFSAPSFHPLEVASDGLAAAIHINIEYFKK